MTKSTILKLIEAIPPFAKIDLVKKTLSIDLDFIDDVEFLPSDSSQYFKLKYFGQEDLLSYFSVFDNPEQMSEDINIRIEDAKGIDALENPIELDTAAITLEEDNDFFMTHIVSCESEEELADLFSNDLSKLKSFTNSPEYLDLDPETRGFIWSVLEHPFKSLWSGSN